MIVAVCLSIFQGQLNKCIGHEFDINSISLFMSFSSFEYMTLCVTAIKNI